MRDFVLNFDESLHISKKQVNIYTYIPSDSFSKCIKDITNITDDMNNIIYETDSYGNYKRVHVLIGIVSNFKSSRILYMFIDKLADFFDTKVMCIYNHNRIILRKNSGKGIEELFTYVGECRLDMKKYKNYKVNQIDLLAPMIKVLCPNTLSHLYKKLNYPDDSDRFEKIERWSEMDGLSDNKKELPADAELYLKRCGGGGRVLLGTVEKPAVEKLKFIHDKIIDMLKQKPFVGRAYKVVEMGEKRFKTELDIKYVINKTVIVDGTEYAIHIEMPIEDSEKLKAFFGHA